MTITTSFAVKRSNRFSSRVFRASNPLMPNSHGWPSEKLTRSGSAIASSRDAFEKLKQSRNSVLAVLIAYRSSISYLPRCTLSQYPHLEDVPKDWQQWHPSIRKARMLSESLFNLWTDALLFRNLATPRLNVPVFDTVEDLGWNGPRPNFEEYCRQMKSPDLHARVRRKHQSVALKSA